MDSSLANTPVVAESEWAMDNRVAIDWSFMLMFLLVAGSASSDVSFGSSMLIWSISSRNYDHCGGLMYEHIDNISLQKTQDCVP